MIYTDLVKAIQDFAVDAEASFLTHIPDFIRATEKRIINDADLPLAQHQAAPTVALNTATVAMPADFLSVDSLAVTVAGELQFLTSKTVDFLQTAYPVATATGVPRYYAVKDAATLQLAPVPDGAYVSQLRYSGYPESIVTASTTWIGTNYEHALLYGALRDAAVYLKEDADIVTMYNNQYNEALGQLKSFSSNKSRVDKYRKR